MGQWGFHLRQKIVVKTSQVGGTEKVETLNVRGRTYESCSAFRLGQNPTAEAIPDLLCHWKERILEPIGHESYL